MSPQIVTPVRACRIFSIEIIGLLGSLFLIFCLPKIIYFYGKNKGSVATLQILLYTIDEKTLSFSFFSIFNAIY